MSNRELERRIKVLEKKYYKVPHIRNRPFRMGYIMDHEHMCWLEMPDGSTASVQLTYHISELILLRDSLNRFLERTTLENYERDLQRVVGKDHAGA